MGCALLRGRGVPEPALGDGCAAVACESCDVGNGGHDHVTLLAGHRSDGSPAFETVPAQDRGLGHFTILGTPGIALGCAEGDTVRVAGDGSFEVLERGGNVAIHIYPTATLSEHHIAELSDAFRGVGGKCERHPGGRSAVATVPALAGFAEIERVMAAWTPSDGTVEWYFANVYDDNNEPLRWWE